MDVDIESFFFDFAGTTSVSADVVMMGWFADRLLSGRLLAAFGVRRSELVL